MIRWELVTVRNILTHEELMKIGEPLIALNNTYHDRILRLETLIRWIGAAWCYEDPATGETVVNDPHFPAFNIFGQPMPGNAELLKTWREVMHQATSPGEPEDTEAGGNSPGSQIER